MAEKRPDRVLGPLNDTFWEYCTKREFRLQKCDGCGHHQWPPTPICSECLDEHLTWTELSGKGTIKTFIYFERQYFPECEPPWPVIMVQLNEGPWFISNPKDISEQDMKIGSPVKVSFLDCEDGAGQFKLPVFGKA